MDTNNLVQHTGCLRLGAHLENTTVPVLKLFTDKGRQCYAGWSGMCLAGGTDEVSSDEAEVTPDGNQGWALTTEE